MNRETPRANRLWAYLIVEELVRCGVEFFCVAPGSRSTPLIAALAANHKARSLIHFDERGTAFAALGYARATGRPAAWITTSGTAVANGLPAVVEASTDGVPMVLLTADRPPELRQTGANQTVDQPDIFGDFVRWRFDLPAPDPEIDPAMVLTTVDQAVYRARRAPSGPVHLNLM
ncbi:MAG: 2-succinyl-5-enolpyruvyl-6-hydroxy-3-cyclohexene-1-carboxylic-acid synthase, partial [Rubrobacteraceae bacterium]|nr:2-succinyl-5-enolpyruvyl-6-hydroxy-3-cyclohexene-1-carboxylic-acid synthase [Rubrobacteraceae bacterium]